MDTKLILQPLTPDLILKIWTKTYNAQGKPDWSHIFPYYHEDIIFEDSIQRIEGITAFKALCERLTKRSKQLTMQITAIASHEEHIFFEWIMTITFKKNPNTPVYGSTHLTLAPDGRIIHQRDYYDLWGDIFKAIPWFQKPYRKFMHKNFG